MNRFIYRRRQQSQTLAHTSSKTHGAVSSTPQQRRKSFVQWASKKLQKIQVRLPKAFPKPKPGTSEPESSHVNDRDVEAASPDVLLSRNGNAQIDRNVTEEGSLSPSSDRSSSLFSETEPAGTQATQPQHQVQAAASEEQWPALDAARPPDQEINSAEEGYGAEFEQLTNQDLDSYIDQIVARNARSRHPNKLERLMGWIARKKLSEFIASGGEDSPLKEKKEELRTQNRALEVRQKNERDKKKRWKELSNKLEKKIIACNTKIQKLDEKIARGQEPEVRGFNRLIPASRREDPEEKLRKREGKRQALYNQLQQNTKRIDTLRQGLEQVEDKLIFLDSEKQRLIEQSRDLDRQLAEVKKTRDEIAKQLVTMLFNLRRVHHKKEALSPLDIPKLSFGDPPTVLTGVKVWPKAIKTRRDENGQYYVDITLGDLRAQINTPIDGVEPLDLGLEANTMTVTIGGEVAKSLTSYLDSKNETTGLLANMRGLAKQMYKTVEALKGRGNVAPVKLKVDFDDVKVTAGSTKASVVSRAVAMARRNPRSSLHQVMAGLPVQVEGHVNHLRLTSAGEVAAELDCDDVEIVLKPDSSGPALGAGAAPERTRFAAVEASAAQAKVRLAGPLKLVGCLGQQLKVYDPLSQLGVDVSPGTLENLPDSVSRQLDLKACNLKISLGREVHNRTTLASPDKPVWFVEGASHSHVEAETLEVKNTGDLGIDGQLHKVGLDVRSNGKKSDVVFQVGEDGRSAGHADITCAPGVIPSLGRTANVRRLNELQARGQLHLDLSGRNMLAYDSDSETVTFTGSELQANAATPVFIKAGGARVSLPHSLNGQAKGARVSTSKSKLVSGFEEQRTEAHLDLLNTDGDGEITVETDLRNDEDGQETAGRVFKIPLRGHLEVHDLGPTAVKHTHSSKRRSREVVMLHPRRVAAREIGSGNIHITEVAVALDEELTGTAQLRDVEVQFNDLLNPLKIGKTEGGAPARRISRLLNFILRNKTLVMDGRVAVTCGCFTLSDLAAANVRVITDKKIAREKLTAELSDLQDEIGTDQPTQSQLNRVRELEGKLQMLTPASLTDRCVATVVNLGVRVVTGLLGGKIIRISSRDNAPVIRSRLAGELPIPVPRKLQEVISLGPDGVVNIPAAQCLKSGVFCFPKSVEKKLYSLVKSVMSGSVADLNHYKVNVQKCLEDPTRIPEALYLLQMFPLEAVIAQIQGQAGPSLVSGLKQIADLAASRRETVQVALAIHNNLSALGVPTDEPVLQKLENCIVEHAMDATELAELLYCQGYEERAIEHLGETIKKYPKNSRALKNLADMLWKQGDCEQALHYYLKAAMAGNSSIIETLEKHAEGPPANSAARLHLGALRLRKEAFEHDAGAFFKGVMDLEMLVTDTQYANAAKTILLKRCERAWLVSQDLEVEEWQLWHKSVNETVAALRKGQRPSLNDDTYYKMAMSLMYSCNGIDQDLDAAELVFENMNHHPPKVAAHRQILMRELKRRRLAQKNNKAA